MKLEDLSSLEAQIEVMGSAAVALPLSYGARLAVGAASAVASALLARRAGRGAAPGRARGWRLVAPAMLLVLPAALFDRAEELMTTVILSTMLGWFSLFKLLALALGRGQASASPAKPRLERRAPTRRALPPRSARRTCSAGANAGAAACPGPADRRARSER